MQNNAPEPHDVLHIDRLVQSQLLFQRRPGGWIARRIWWYERIHGVPWQRMHNGKNNHRQQEQDWDQLQDTVRGISEYLRVLCSLLRILHCSCPLIPTLAPAGARE